MPTRFFIPVESVDDLRNDISQRYYPQVLPNVPIFKRACNEVYSTIDETKYNIDHFDLDARLIKQFGNVKNVNHFNCVIDFNFDDYDYLLFSLRREPGKGAWHIFDIQIKFALDVICFLKNEFPKAKVIVGGTQFLEYKEMIEKQGLIDYFHKGHVIPETMQEILDGNYPQDRTGRFVANNIHPPSNSDEFEYTYNELMEFYGLSLPNLPDKKMKLAEVALVKGCKGTCAFCTSAVERVQEIDFYDMILSYLDEGFNAFAFMNDCINPIAEKLCNWIAQKNLKFYWTDSSRHSLDPDYFKMLYEAGCRGLHFGVETVDNEILKYVNKRFTHEQMHESITLSHEAGLWNIVSIITNLPYSKEQESTYDYLLANRDIIQEAAVFQFTFYAESLFYLYPEKYKLEFKELSEGNIIWKETEGRGYEETKELGKRNLLTQDLIESDILDLIPPSLLFVLYDYYNDKQEVINFLARNDIKYVERKG